MVESEGEYLDENDENDKGEAKFSLRIKARRF